MKHLLARTCVVILALGASLLAIAQSLPVFGTAKFGQAVFGEASVGTTGVGADALPVPFYAYMGNPDPRSRAVGCRLYDAF